MDAETGPGAVASGGGDWKAVEGAADKKKRGRSPDDEGENDRMVSASYTSLSNHCPTNHVSGYTSTLGRYRSRRGAYVVFVPIFLEYQIIIIAYIMCSNSDDRILNARTWSSVYDTRLDYPGSVMREYVRCVESEWRFV